MLKLELPTVHHPSPPPVPDSCLCCVKDLVSWFTYSHIGEESQKISHEVSNLAGGKWNTLLDLEMGWGVCQETPQHMLEGPVLGYLAFSSRTSCFVFAVEQYRGNSRERERGIPPVPCKLLQCRFIIRIKGYNQLYFG